MNLRRALVVTAVLGSTALGVLAYWHWREGSPVSMKSPWGRQAEALVGYTYAQRRFCMDDLDCDSENDYAQSLEELRDVSASEYRGETCLPEAMVKATSPENAFGGHYFVMLPPRKSSEEDFQKYAWPLIAGLGPLPPLVEIPADRERNPFYVFYVDEGAYIYYKDTGGKVPEALPEDPLSEGWERYFMFQRNRARGENVMEQESGLTHTLSRDARTTAPDVVPSSGPEGRAP